MSPEGLEYFPDFLPPVLQAEIERFLRSVSYECKPYGPTYRDSTQPLNRGYRQFGWEYDSLGTVKAGPEPLPPLLQSALQICRAKLPQPTSFDQAVAMYYPVGGGLGWHVDGARFGPVIVALSFAGNASLEFRRGGEQEASYRLQIAPGAMYVLARGSRWDFEHRILPVEQERYSITFRTIGQPETPAGSRGPL